MEHIYIKQHRKLKGLLAALVLALGWSFLPGQAAAQFTTNCSNSNFSNGNWKGWSACWGNWYCAAGGPCCNVWKAIQCETPSFHPTGHKLIAAPGYLDPQTGGGLLNVYPGEAYSARLGDSLTGDFWDRLSYQITVSDDDYLFVYRYAVVLQDPGHDSCNQPGFFISITGPDGQLLDSTCGYYAVTAQPGLPGWNTFGQTIWRDWTTVGMNLSDYVGQTLTVTFTSRDCSQSGHYGYAYFNAYCNALQMQVALCEDDTVAVLTAPAGFDYLWSNDSTTNSIIVPNPTLGATYWVKITSYNGCTDTIFATLTYTVVDAGFDFVSNCATLPVQFTDTSHINQNNVVNWEWIFGDGDTITGVQNPTHAYAVPDTFEVRLVAFSTEGCSDTTYRQVIVDSLPHLTNTPLFQQICHNTEVSLTLVPDILNAQFTWTAAGTSPNVGGFQNQATLSTILHDTLTNTGNQVDSVIYTITPIMGACTGPDSLYIFEVLPIPDLTNTPVVNSQCTNLWFNLDMEGTHDSTKYTWTASASSLNLSGYTSNTTTPDTLIHDLLLNSGFTTDTVYYEIVPHLFGCPGDTVIYKVAVFPTPNLTNTPLADTICNNTGPGITLTSAVSGAQFTWTCTASPGITGWSNITIPTTLLNQVLLNPGAGLGNVVYHITPQANGCSGAVTDLTIYVNPIPVVTNSPMSKTQCSGVNTNVTLTGNMPGTQFTWTATGTPGISGFTNNSTPGTLISDVLVNSGNALGTATYSITAHFDGCMGNPMNYVVNVQPVPLLSNNPPSKEICNNTSPNVTLTSNVNGALFTWTCSSSSGNVGGFTANAVPTNLLDQTLTNSGSTPETVTYHITPCLPAPYTSCTGPVTDFVVTVYPVPLLTNSPASKEQCNQQNTNITLQSNVGGALFTWTATGTPGVTGFSNNNIPSGTIGDVLNNSTWLDQTVTYQVTPVANNCPGPPAPYTVTVHPTPDLSNTPLSKQQCNNTATNITLTSHVNGTLFTWTCTQASGNVTGFSANAIPTTSLNHTLVNSSNAPDFVVYHIQPIANNCNGPVTDYTVTVFPTADVVFTPPSQTFCTGNPTGITLTSNVGGTTFTWTASGSSPNVSGFGPGSGNSIVQTLFNSGASVETVTYTVTPTANLCTGTPGQVIVTVNPGPLLTTSPLAQTLCSGSSTNISLTSNVSSATYTWTTTPSSPNLSGFSNGSGNTIIQPLTNSGYTIETVVYHIYPSANGCTGGPTDYTVTVKPIPDLSTTPLSSQLCSGNNTNIALLSNVIGTSFTWTVTDNPNVNGELPGSGSLISQVLTNLGFNPELVVYHITPSANGCTGSVYDFTVNLVQTPDVYFTPPAQTLCSGTSCSINILSHVAGSTFTWTVATSPNTTGATAGSGNLINQLLTNTSNIAGTATYTATPSAAGCPPGIPQSVVVTVNPTPLVTNSQVNSQVCSGGTTNITPQSTVANSTFAWTASGSSPSVTGFSNGSGMTINQALTNGGFNTESVTYTVHAIANACPGPDVIFTVTVFPVANVIFTPATQAFCTPGTTAINLSSGVGGTTYSWTATGSSPDIGGYTPGTGNLIQQGVYNNGYAPGTVTYTVAPQANGCPGTSGTAVVTVNPLPVVSFVNCFDPMVTTSSQAVTLKGATPRGGTFSGTGVSGTQFLPGTAGPGTHTITYTYINTYGCMASANQTITVVSPVPVICGNNILDIRDNQSYRTVQIGAQCWMAVNLNYGNVITSGQMQRDNCIPEKYCFGDNLANCTSIGGLYQWDEMMKYSNASGDQGFCPPDWHVPTEGDWNNLFTFFISNGFAGSPLKYTGYSGFDAFLTGVRFNNVQWDFSNFAVFFWSSTAHGPKKAWAHAMNTYNPSVSFYPSHRNNAFLVRCIKN